MLSQMWVQHSVQHTPHSAQSESEPAGVGLRWAALDADAPIDRGWFVMGWPSKISSIIQSNGTSHVKCVWLKSNIFLTIVYFYRKHFISGELWMCQLLE